MSDETDLSILTRRRAELMARRSEAMALITETDKELALNEATGAYLAKLTGAEWPPAGEANPVAPKKTYVLKAETGHYTLSGGNTGFVVSRSFPAPEMTTPEMILAVLADAIKDGFEGLAPAEIGQRMVARFKFTLPKDGISPTVWRLWKDGRLQKIRDGFYTLPENDKATDLLSSREQSAAS